MNHTPGPWPIEGLRPWDKDIVIPGPGVWVDYDDVNHEEAMANAKLIAASPDLLTACKIALDALGEDRTPSERRGAERLIHEAVKKATL